ncbi:AAA family ATPase, partial [Acidisphaera rubrifaciens]|uniref:AAA family ATPase n=1 Tax=Acidisphaera rubrifaciens TaxID=50715 RepID=UPI00130D65F7
MRRAGVVDLKMIRPGYGGDPGLLIEIMANVHRAVARRSVEAGALVRVAVSARSDLGLAAEALPALSRQDGETTLTPAEWTRLGTALTAARRRHKRGELDDWMAALGRALGLDEIEAAVLRLAVAYRQDTYVEGLWDALSQARWRGTYLCLDPALFGLLLDQPGALVGRALAADGRLRTSGLLAVDDDDGSIAVLQRLYTLIARRLPLPDDVRSLLVSQPRPPQLAWEAFHHLGEAAETAARVLRAALERQEKGVGILLYGPPGTGKTEFAATLAAHVGAALYPVGETDAAGEEPTRGERLADLRLSQRLIDATGGVLLFDEMEDLFATNMFGRRDTPSRVFLHRLIEQGGAPVIWTANDISVVGPAVARRMMLCIELRQPPAAARA